MSTKHALVRNRLEAAIRSGEFGAGERLPGEQDLAERYGVSYMTARKAVQDLVLSEMVERRARTGTFVRPLALERLQKQTLNLVTYEYDGAWQRKFISYGLDLAEREGWNANVIRLTPGQQESAVRVIQHGELAIVFVDELARESALAHAMRAAKGRAVLINSLLADEGIPSVSYDIERTLDFAWGRLMQAGHRRIGLVVQAPADLNALAVIERWKGKNRAEWTEREITNRLIWVNTPKFQSPAVAASATLCAYFVEHKDELSALICLGDEMALGIVGASHRAGRTVSLINLGDSPLLEVSVPPVTCVDAGIEEQLRLAVQILKLPRYKLSLDDMQAVVEPHLIERESVFAIE